MQIHTHTHTPARKVSLYLKDTRVQQATADSSWPQSTSWGSRFICAQARIARDKRRDPHNGSRSTELQPSRLPLNCWPLFRIILADKLVAWEGGGWNETVDSCMTRCRSCLTLLQQFMWHFVFFFSFFFCCMPQMIHLSATGCASARKRSLHLALA